MVLGLVLLCVLLIVFNNTSEPRYHGRSLSSWLQQCSEASSEETLKLAEAQAAVRAIGARKALPELIKLVKTRESRVRAWLDEKMEKFGINFFHGPPATELQLRGIAGFEVLGTNAAPALGELMRLLGDKDLAFVAARSLEYIGKPAEASLCQCLTNKDLEVRRLSVFALASVTEDVEVYLARIKDRLKDSDPYVRCAAVEAIGA